MGGGYCVVPGCTSNTNARSEPKRCFFGAPRNEDRRKLWERAIPRANWTLSDNSKVCDLHFDESYIKKTDKFVIRGETVELDRLKWTLTTDAVPTIFPNLPKYLTKTVKKRKAPKERSLQLPEKRKRVQKKSAGNDQEEVQHLTFEELADQLMKPEEHTQFFPSTKWNVHYVDEQKALMFVMMTEVDGTPHCAIVLRVDSFMRTSLVVSGCKISQYQCEVNTTDDLHTLLVQLDGARICSGFKRTPTNGGIRSVANEHTPQCDWILRNSKITACAACRKKTHNIEYYLKNKNGARE